MTAPEPPAPTPDRAPGTEGERLIEAEIDALEHVYRAALPADEWAHALRLDADGNRLWYADGDQAATVHDNLGLGLDADRVAAWLAAIASAGPRLLADLRATRRERDEAQRTALGLCEAVKVAASSVSEIGDAKARAESALATERAEHAATRAEGERVRAALARTTTAAKYAAAALARFTPDRFVPGLGFPVTYDIALKAEGALREIDAALAPAQSTEANDDPAL